ncbi:MAG: ATP-binding protein [Proteobacteria bacterium]|nr:ATP-binding protein [Pseudomonadota bacterium]
MDPVRNPFAPGAGSQPPALAGRRAIVDEARIALNRVIQGRSSQSQLLLGFRGVGKTVLLNKIEELALDAGYLASFIEAPEDRPLPDLLYPKLHQVLRKLSVADAAKAKAVTALRALKSFASAFRVTVGDVSIAYEPQEGTADSGDLDADLSELFLLVGQAAKEAGKGWALLIDEVQYLSGKDLSALIVALHRVSQKNLPIVFFGAGLPQLAGMAGDAKSYAERLFTYPMVDALDVDSARHAIRQPVEDEEESIEDPAVAAIVEQTKGYPYFLQEWGFQAWNHAQGERITRMDVESATQAATRRLDEGFFNVRLERLTPRERDYVYAMASLGSGPYRSNDVAQCLGDTTQSLGPCRAKIISKGMIYSPAHGDIAFTVPMFDDFLRRNFPERIAPVQKK